MTIQKEDVETKNQTVFYNVRSGNESVLFCAIFGSHELDGWTLAQQASLV